jgi:hypothetical protein
MSENFKKKTSEMEGKAIYNSPRVALGKNKKQVYQRRPFTYKRDRRDCPDENIF